MRALGVSQGSLDMVGSVGGMPRSNCQRSFSVVPPLWQVHSPAIVVNGGGTRNAVSALVQMCGINP